MSGRISFRAGTSQTGKGLMLAWALLMGLGLFSPNVLLTEASLLALLLIVKLLWRPGEPPVLLWAMGYHWLQACIMTMDANLRGLSLVEMDLGRGVTTAAWLSLAGVVVLALGLRVGAGSSLGRTAQDSLRELGGRLSVRRLFWGSLIALGASQALSGFAWAVPGLTQQLLAFKNLHWVVIFLFTYAVLCQHRGYGYLAIVFLVEIGVGFLGFFSGFKDVVIIMMLASLAAPSAFKGLQLRTAFGLGAVVLSLGLVWTSVKEDYRRFLNLGTGDQVILVPMEARAAKLVELTADLKPSKMADALEKMSNRIGYVKYFGESTLVVPDVIPYEGGKLWWEAILNALVPRLLNPGKRVINDSERTSYYTGSWVSGVQEGTSISLGYIAESYIDFGPVGMFVPLLIYALALGGAYRLLLRTAPHPLLGLASTTGLIALSAAALETSNAKLVAGVILGFVALFIIQKALGKGLLRMFTTLQIGRNTST